MKNVTSWHQSQSAFQQMQTQHLARQACQTTHAIRVPALWYQKLFNVFLIDASRHKKWRMRRNNHTAEKSTTYCMKFINNWKLNEPWQQVFLTCAYFIKQHNQPITGYAYLFSALEGTSPHQIASHAWKKRFWKVSCKRDIFTRNYMKREWSNIDRSTLHHAFHLSNNSAPTIIQWGKWI